MAKANLARFIKVAPDTFDCRMCGVKAMTLAEMNGHTCERTAKPEEK